MRVVSACLAGIKCRYHGKAEPCKKVIDLVRRGKALPLCPEQLGGLPTPRPPTEIREGRIYTRKGEDVTDKYKRGAQEGLKIAKLIECRVAILKTRSPSCGSGRIYDGSFLGRLVKGDGIFAKLLKKEGIKVLTEKDI